MPHQILAARHRKRAFVHSSRVHPAGANGANGDNVMQRAGKASGNEFASAKVARFAVRGKIIRFHDAMVSKVNAVVGKVGPISLRARSVAVLAVNTANATATIHQRAAAILPMIAYATMARAIAITRTGLMISSVTANVTIAHGGRRRRIASGLHGPLAREHAIVAHKCDVVSAASNANIVAGAATTLRHARATNIAVTTTTTTPLLPLRRTMLPLIHCDLIESSAVLILCGLRGVNVLH